MVLVISIRTRKKVGGCTKLLAFRPCEVKVKDIKTCKYISSADVGSN